MSSPYQELRILHRKGIYPGSFGGNLRTLNIARLAREIFENTTLFSMDNTTEYEGVISGVPVIQEKEFRNPWERIPYYFRALTARELVVPYTERAFLSGENSLFQIEDPLLYPLLKKKGVSRFILDEHNVNWETYSFVQPQLQAQLYSKIAFRRNKDNEKRALLHAAHILCCSSRDRDILVSEVPKIENRISIIPNCVNYQEYASISDNSNFWVRGPHQGRILFVGIMTHPPNADAARLICDAIAPFCPDNEFLVIGKNPLKISYPKNVRFLGYVDDVKSVIAGSDVCIAPLRYGSGTRIKILEYMAMGKPVIATAKGAEGIEYSDGLNIIIEDRIEKYPEVIRMLLDDDRKRNALGREAARLIREKYDWELYRKLLGTIYRKIGGM